MIKDDIETSIKSQLSASLSGNGWNVYKSLETNNVRWPLVAVIVGHGETLDKESVIGLYRLPLAVITQCNKFNSSASVFESVSDTVFDLVLSGSFGSAQYDIKNCSFMDNPNIETNDDGWTATQMYEVIVGRNYQTQKGCLIRSALYQQWFSNDPP